MGRYRILVLIAGLAVIGIGVGLNESGVDFGRMLFIAGLPITVIGIGILVWPRRAPQVEVDLGEDPIVLVAQHWGMTLAEGKASGMVKGRQVDLKLRDDDLIKIRALAVRALDMGLTVLRGGKPPGDARKEYSTGDTTFDTEYCVRVDEPERAENLLTERLRTQLLSAHASLSDKGVELLMPRVDADSLAEAVRLGCTVAGELDRASPKVRCAEPLADTRERWLAYAAERKLATADTPLSMWGQIDGFKVQVLAVRDAFQQFHFELTADFPSPLARGLSLKPASSATQFDRTGDPIGHPAFDKLFMLKATDPTDAAAPRRPRDAGSVAPPSRQRATAARQR